MSPFAPCLLVYALVAAAGPGPTPRVGPVETVREVYRSEKAMLERAGPSPLAESERRRFFSRRFVALWAADESFARATGDLGNVVGDHDVLIQAQDHDETTLGDLRVSLSSRSPERAVVTATFHVFRHEPAHEVRFVLVVEGGRWVIDDILHEGRSEAEALAWPRPCVEGLDLPCVKGKEP